MKLYPFKAKKIELKIEGQEILTLAKKYFEMMKESGTLDEIPESLIDAASYVMCSNDGSRDATLETAQLVAHGH